MNAPLAQPSRHQRHAFTIEDVLRMQDAGFFGGDMRIALHEGDIVHMGSDGDLHIRITMRLMERIVLQLAGTGRFVGVQTTLRLARTNAPSPDIYVLEGGPPEGDVAAERILLVVEVADSSLADDLRDSAARYARAGVAELWVVDAQTRTIHVHRAPGDGAYPPPETFDAEAIVSPARLPELSVRLADLC